VNATRRKKSASTSPIFHKLLHVFAQHIGFKIHRVADFAFAQGGDFEGVGDDPDAEAFFGHIGDGEADAVHGDGAFEDDVAQDIGGCGNVEDVVGAGAFPAGDFAEAIHVAGDEVSAEASACGEGAFEVYMRARLHELQVGAQPGFAEQIEAKPRARAFALQLRDGEAAAVDGDAVAVACVPTANACLHDQFYAGGAFPNAFDEARFFDNASEHWG
jgi:hypothetical protein